MKTARILNRKPIDYLFDHVLDGFALTRKGLRQALDAKLITIEEYWQLVDANQDRVLERIKQFKIVNKLFSITFASLLIMANTWAIVPVDSAYAGTMTRRPKLSVIVALSIKRLLRNVPLAVASVISPKLLRV